MSDPQVRVGSSVPDAASPVLVGERKLGAGPSQWLALGAIALATVAADQLTKHLVASQLQLGDGVHVAGPLWIRHVQNSGIAFGLFSRSTAVVIVLTGIAIIWMLAYFARSGARHPVLPVALGLVIGGSSSNLVDRVRLGYVTDFIDFRWWPAFNLADSFIVIGVLVLLAALVYAEREPPRRSHPGGRRSRTPSSGRARAASPTSLPASRDAPPRPS
ncbi:MAG TPA: signal peptidase II [Gaiellaceae bacterium]